MPGMPTAPDAPSAPGVPGEYDQAMQYIPKGGKSGGGVYVACKPPPLEIFVQADAALNPNEKGQPMPVEVRALLLKERTTFDTLDFETVWQQAQQSLDKVLVASASLTVYPSKLKIYPIKSSLEVAYVALVGIFRKPEGTSWKYVVDVRQANRRCAAGDDLHTIVHAEVRGNRIGKPAN
jgi:type VI secretion system protein VasD